MKQAGKDFKAIINGTIVSHGNEIRDGIITMEGSKILEAGKRGSLEIQGEAEIIDAEGNFIIPGMIDIHVNGAMGEDVTKVTAKTFDVMGKFFASHGATSFLATAITCADEDFLKTLESARDLMRNRYTEGAELLGIHMEGPYLSYNQRGAHPAKFLSIPAKHSWKPFLEYNDVLVKMTIAPELEGAAQLVRDMKNNGIIAAAGHTDGVYPEIKEAVDAGITHTTHFFCNMSHFRRHNMMRVAGMVESLLYDDRITGELIADGWHLDPVMMKLLVKVKGAGKVCLVTDAMPGTGLPDGRYFIGDVEAIVEKGYARLPDSSAYAGSIATMDICLKNGVNLIELSLADAVQAVTLTPAKIIGVNDRKGSIEKGKDADIVIIDKEFNVIKTLVRGKVEFTR